MPGADGSEASDCDSSSDVRFVGVAAIGRKRRLDFMATLATEQASAAGADSGWRILRLNGARSVGSKFKRNGCRRGWNGGAS
jgi:hypothetical protein